MSGKTAIAAGAVVLVVAAAAGLGALVLSDSGDDTPDSGDPVEVEPGDQRSGDERSGGDGDGEGAGLRGKREREREPVPAAPPEPGALWIPIEGAPDAMVALDWTDLGGKLAALVPMLAEVANQAARGEPPMGDLSERLVTLRLDIDNSIGRLDEHLASVYPTDILSHPAMAANAIAVTLHTRGMGLSEEQRAALTESANAAHTAEEAAAARESEHEWRLLRACDAFERRTAYFAEFENLLTKRQRRGLHAEITRGRVRLDLFSAATIWDATAHPLPVTDEPSIEAAATAALLGTMGLDAKQMQTGHEIIARRLKERPAELLGTSSTWTEVFGFVKGERVVLWARWSVDVLLEVLSDLARGRLPAAPPDVLDSPAVFVWDPDR